MGSRDSRIDAYISRSQPFARPILKRLRGIVHAGCPDVEETMKWSFPHFLHHGMLCSMASFRHHCAFGFWKASLLKGGGRKSAEAMGQYGRITSLDDLPARNTLVRLVKQAAALNEQGIAVVRATRPPKPPAKARNWKYDTRR